MLRTVTTTLLRPRWIVLTLAVVLLVVVFLNLAAWQWHRHEDRRAVNEQVLSHEDETPRPVDRVTAPDRPMARTDEYTPVRVRGTYDVRHQLLVRYRASVGGEPGFEVLVPLVTESGAALLVNRGWIPRGDSQALPTPPPPPSGEVTVTGRMRVSESGEAKLGPKTADVRYIDVPTIAESLPYPVYGGFAELTDQVPAPGGSPVPLPMPEVDDGPHLSYAVQWCLFALIAVIGWLFLLVDDVTGGRLREKLRRRPLPEELAEDAAEAAKAAKTDQARSSAGRAGTPVG